MKQIIFTSLFIVGITCISFAQRTAKYLVTDTSNWNISIDGFKPSGRYPTGLQSLPILVIIDDKVYSTTSPEFLNLKKQAIKDSKIIKSTDATSPVQGVIIITTKKD